MKRVSLIICSSMLLFACTSTNEVSQPQKSPSTQTSVPNNDSEKKIQSLERKNTDLEKQVQEYESRETELNDNIRTTLNYTIQILKAMRTKEYDYLESVISPKLTVNKESDILTYTDENGKVDELKFLSYSIDDLEYRFFHFSDQNNLTLGFARIHNEMQIEIEFEYVREHNGKWLFNRYYTN